MRLWQMPESGCAVCKLIRFYLLLAAPLIVMLGFSQLNSDEAMYGDFWIARVELIDFLAYGSLLALFTIIGFRAYQEYWQPRKRQRRLHKLLDNGDEE